MVPRGPMEGTMARTQSPNGNAPDEGGEAYISSKLHRIATLAKEQKETVFTSLAHLLDYDLLVEAYRRTRKSGAVGIDNQTAKDYAADLERNLKSLHERLRSGRYVAPPVRRVHLPKPDGKTRPIGIPTFEDKIVQRGVVMLLEPLYEPLFYDFSYGFRPKRSAHDALEAFWKRGMDVDGGWIIELDIQSYFDKIPHNQLRAFLNLRVKDKAIHRLIGKWLNAGVMEQGQHRRTDSGSPQGGVISPLLANIFLHYVLDQWFEEMVRPCMRGSCHLIRYADDAVLLFANESDANRVLNTLPKRFAKYGLTLHPEKTRLVDFRKPRWPETRKRGVSIDFLGFRHTWGPSYKQGRPVIKRATAPSRLRRSLHNINRWCRLHRHHPVDVQYAALTQKLRGHYGYFGLIGNRNALRHFWCEVRGYWQRWLNRRSNRARMSWKRFYELLKRYPLPEPPSLSY
jgi:RNA-directed DNA polymerase